MKKSVTSTLVLVCICAVMAVLLAVTNAITAPIIKENSDKAANEALLQVMPNGTGFEKMDISGYTLPATVTDAYKEANGGYVIMLKTTGYSSDFIIMCGVNADGTVSGAVCLSSTETLGYEKRSAVRPRPAPFSTRPPRWVRAFWCPPRFTATSS